MNYWKAVPQPSSANAELLKAILEQTENPAALNAHPWCQGPLVDELLHRRPELRSSTPGRKLLFALAMLFEDMMPSVPPRRGLRLDTQWGEFGLLAARYFTAIMYGATMPSSLRDAWGRIDQAILLFLSDEKEGTLSAADVERYRLVGNESEVAPDSTLSDWHRKGLDRLAAALRKRAAGLTEARPLSSQAGGRPAKPTRAKIITRVVSGAVGAVIVVGLCLGGIKAYRLFQLGQAVRADVGRLQAAMPASLEIRTLHDAAQELPQLDRDLKALQTEGQPLLVLAPMFTSVPTYGGDISQAPALLDFAHHLAASAQFADAGLLPLLDASTEDPSLGLSDAVSMLVEARPELVRAQSELTAAMDARNRLRPEMLSPGIREVITDKIDPRLGLLQDGLTVALSMPSLMGAGSNGPQTYLLVAQNEDELRPTGGFITAVGKLVVDQGHVVSLSFENSGDLDNWSMPYPMAPWQLSEYMNSPVLILRDTNWFPDYPLSVLYLKQLYAYVHQESVDGVIAFDQQMLMRLLRVLGPIQVQDVAYPITADNVVEYMRQAKTAPLGQTIPEGWTYKAFVGKLATAVLNRLLSAGLTEWRPLSEAAMQGFQERHIVMQLDDPDVSAILARRNWNGALSSQGGDFLTVIDSNVGFTKSNAVVNTSLSYDVDLSDLTTPRSHLLVSHTNRASSDVPCIEWDDEGVITEELDYPINRCYWDYMRVYAPAGTILVDSTPQAIPDSWMILNKHVEPRVDMLEEEHPGISGFGTLLVVPAGGTINTSMTFELPASAILTRNPDGSISYLLNVRKQPGTLAVPITIRVHLPRGSTLEGSSGDWIVDGSNILIEADLKVDLRVEMVFRAP